MVGTVTIIIFFIVGIFFILPINFRMFFTTDISVANGDVVVVVVVVVVVTLVVIVFIVLILIALVHQRLVSVEIIWKQSTPRPQ